jgi:hypothetical protein
MPAFRKLAAALSPSNMPPLRAPRLSGKTFESCPQRKITVAKLHLLETKRDWIFWPQHICIFSKEKAKPDRLVRPACPSIPIARPGHL